MNERIKTISCILVIYNCGTEYTMFTVQNTSLSLTLIVTVISCTTSKDV